MIARDRSYLKCLVACDITGVTRAAEVTTIDYLSGGPYLDLAMTALQLMKTDMLLIATRKLRACV